MPRPLTHEDLRTLAADARAGYGCSNPVLCQLLSLLRFTQDRLNLSAPLLDWLNETGFSALYTDPGVWSIGRPERRAIGRARNLPLAIRTARDAWQRHQDTMERQLCQLAVKSAEAVTAGSVM